MKSPELFHSGLECRAYHYFGAHESDVGYIWRIWAPGVRSVSVVGDFNNWQPAANPLQEIFPGIYETHIATAVPGQCYKFALTDQSGQCTYRSDPFAFASELRPQNASVLWRDSHFDWGDESHWPQSADAKYARPLNIYELHLGSWRRHADGSFLNYAEMVDELIPYLQELQFTHVELMPLQEHPLDASWGYQVTAYFAVTARYGTAEQFKYMVKRLHEAGFGVILDWVPAHFPKDEHGLARFNGEALYEYADAELRERKVWGTLVFDYGRPEVCSFLLSNAFYWIEEYHLDGLRFDAVSSILYRNYDSYAYEHLEQGEQINEEAVSFLRHVNNRLHEAFPWVLTFAEESSDFPLVTGATAEGGLGFDYKWNLGWMHDTLDYFTSDYVYRPYNHNKLTFSLTYAFSERYVLPLSHDDVVHGKKSLIDKMPGDYWRKFASYRCLLAYLMTHPGAKLLFMGAELAQFNEWHYYEALDWNLLDYEMHRKLRNYLIELNKLYLAQAAFWANEHDWSGFVWLDADDAEHSVFSYIRQAKDAPPCLLIFNMLPSPIEDFCIGVPYSGRWRILLNSDDGNFGGSDYALYPGTSDVTELHTRGKAEGEMADSLAFRLTPLSALILQYIP